MENSIDVWLPLDDVIDQEQPVIPQLEACYLTIAMANQCLEALGITITPDYSEDHPFNVMDRRKHGVQE